MTPTVIALLILAALIAAGIAYYMHNEKAKAQLAMLETNVKAHAEATLGDVAAHVSEEVASLKQHVTDEIAKVAEKATST